MEGGQGSRYQLPMVIVVVDEKLYQQFCCVYRPPIALRNFQPGSVLVLFTFRCLDYLDCLKEVHRRKTIKDKMGKLKLWSVCVVLYVFVSKRSLLSIQNYSI